MLGSIALWTFVGLISHALQSRRTEPFQICNAICLLPHQFFLLFMKIAMKTIATTTEMPMYTCCED